MKTLLIGGARCGKSALAQRWAGDRAANVCALLTGTESDPEMTARIAAHRRARPPHWRVREEPVLLGQALRDETAAGTATHRSGLVLIDCLTLWIANCLWPPQAADRTVAAVASWRRARGDFLDALAACRSEVIIVSNEVGQGIVPADPAARLFRDEQGWLNQAVASVCDEVFVVFAGLPLRLKPT